MSGMLRQKMTFVVGSLSLVGALGVVGWSSTPNPSVGRSSTPNPSEVFQALRRSDEAFLKSYAITLQVDSKLDWGSWEHKVYRVRGTSDGSKAVTVAIHDQITYLKYPDYAFLLEQDRRYNNPNPYYPNIPYLRWRESVFLQEGGRFIQVVIVRLTGSWTGF